MKLERIRLILTSQSIRLQDEEPGFEIATTKAITTALYRVSIHGTIDLMQPSDVVVLFALMNQEGPWTLRSLAARLGVQHSKVQRGIDRLAEAGLYDAGRRRVIPHTTEEFLGHALRYLDPARLGPIVNGVPTAWAAPPLNQQIVDTDPPPVWPDPNGKVRGQSVTPLDERLSSLAETWPEVAELAALADALRLGDARTRDAAREHLHGRIYAHW